VTVEAPTSKRGAVLAVGFLVVIFGLSVWLNVYTVRRASTQAAIEAGEVATATLVDSETYRDVRGWGREFVTYRFEAPAAGGGEATTFEGFRHIDGGLFDVDPKPGDPVQIRYLAEDPTVSNVEGNSAQLTTWAMTCGLVDLVWLWLIVVAIRGARGKEPEATA
jgi:hypothetical protein